MKLLFCSSCHDVKGLVMQEWRTCICGASGGQYNLDGMTATIGGMARVFGVGNPFLNDLYPFLEEKGLKKMQQKFYGHTKGDCWWGEYEGDLQIFRISSKDGPRLRVRLADDLCPLGMMNVYIVDKRDYVIDGEFRRNYVTVPRNTMVKITRWDKKKKAKAKKAVKPKTFFLNEQHEVKKDEK